MGLIGKSEFREKEIDENTRIKLQIVEHEMPPDKKNKVKVNIFGSYIFQPYKVIKQADNLTAFYGNKFENRYFIGSSALVFHSPVGPISLSFHYLQNQEQPFSFLFNFGYIIFNSKAVE